MNTLLKLRRLNRKRAGLSHKPEWLIIDLLMSVFVSGLMMFAYNLITLGFTGWL